MTRSSRLATVLLALATCLSGAALFVGAVPAAAHAILRSIDPADGATLASPPKLVSLTFNESVTTGLSVITVRPATGANVARGTPTAKGPTLTQALAADLPAGRYTIAWKTVSDDGHPISGTSTFTASHASGRTAPSVTSTTTTSAPSPSAAPMASTSSAAGSTAASDTPSGRTGSSGALWLVGLALVIVGLLGWVRALRRHRALKRADHGAESPPTE